MPLGIGLRGLRTVLLIGLREPFKISAHGVLPPSVMLAMHLLMLLAGLVERLLTPTIG